ncbi:hypothetical protein ATANTOWER_015397 [Ataeniobius toweri]|uniref:Uncharacterized protein n=1 Tax=Ataeniobius toweri TaxID=208326 RepID=A0ABU7BZN4_9TELE|nr:hypothetical protein [Ataeniobius toweri]
MACNHRAVSVMPSGCVQVGVCMQCCILSHSLSTECDWQVQFHRCLPRGLTWRVFKELEPRGRHQTGTSFKVDFPPTLASPMVRCSVSTLLDLTESTSEKDVGLSVSLPLLEPASWKLRTILPSTAYLHVHPPLHAENTF